MHAYTSSVISHLVALDGMPHLKIRRRLRIRDQMRSSSLMSPESTSSHLRAGALTMEKEIELRARSWIDFKWRRAEHSTSPALDGEITN
jgi:hypothetical protein